MVKKTPSSKPKKPASLPKSFTHRHLLGIAPLSKPDIEAILSLTQSYAKANRGVKARNSKASELLRGQTIINLFVENSTRTLSSFEIAGKRLGADVINLSVEGSSFKKGETLLDTAVTLNAMQPSVLVVRHAEAGAANLLARKVNCAVINAGDGSHEHPTQALLDATTIINHKGSLQGLLVAICGDILHSRVARSNIHLLQKLGAHVRLIAPETLLPASADRLQVEVFTDMEKGLQDCDIVMMLRLQKERMNGTFLPSPKEYFRFFGLDRQKLSHAKDDALILHPGPMNRGVEIESELADDLGRSLIQEQVEMGVAVRMACLHLLTEALAKYGTGNNKSEGEPKWSF